MSRRAEREGARARATTAAGANGASLHWGLSANHIVRFSAWQAAAVSLEVGATSGINNRNHRIDQSLRRLNGWMWRYRLQSV